MQSTDQELNNQGQESPIEVNLNTIGDSVQITSTRPVSDSALTLNPVNQQPISITRPIVNLTSTIKVADFPDYIRWVFPEPGSKYNIESEAYLNILDRIRYQSLEPSICVDVSSYELMERGDMPSIEDFVGQMYLMIDGEKNTKPNHVGFPEIFGQVYTDSVTGEFLFRTPDGEDFLVCWQVELDTPGIYTVTHVFVKSSGAKEEYSWSFMIKEK